MTIKELKALAKACRAAGIAHYKHGDVEFTLTAESPPKVVRKRITQTADLGADVKFESDTPTGEELLFWSSQGLPNDPGAGEA
jgi:hypothetical protein